MDEAEVDRIEELWKKTIANYPGLSVGYFHEKMKGGPIDVAGLCQAVRAALAETEHVTQRLTEARATIRRLEANAERTAWRRFGILRLEVDDGE